MTHEEHERKRKIKNIRMEMKSLLHKRKRLHRIPENERKMKRKEILNRERELERKLHETKNS